MEGLVADKDRHQWFTPTWAAERLIAAHFPDLGPDDMVVEPTCGIGTFLKAVPRGVPAYGVEIDPALASVAREGTGRDVITGDFTTCDLPASPTAIVGNPPFDLGVVDAILDRCHRILPEGGKAAFILPAYAFQTASRLADYRKRWSVSQEMIPRNLFRNMMKPLCFAVFRKDGLGELRGFALYTELHDVNGMPREAALDLSTTESPWEAALAGTLGRIGGAASEAALISSLEPKSPSGDRWWKARISSTLRSSPRFVEKDGTWTLRKDCGDADFRGT